MSSNFHMVCGQGATTYSWTKDGIPFDGQRIVVVTNETGDPFGLYTCVAGGVIRQWYLPVQSSKGTRVVEAKNGELGGEGQADLLKCNIPNCLHACTSLAWESAHGDLVRHVLNLSYQLFQCIST